MMEYTNFCMNKDCLVPLCPECFKSHINEHKKSRKDFEFESLDSAS